MIYIVAMYIFHGRNKVSVIVIIYRKQEHWGGYVMGWSELHVSIDSSLYLYSKHVIQHFY